MKTILALSLAAGCWLLVLSQRNADSAEVLRAVGCPKTDAPPVVDGSLDDACWKQASVIDNFGILRSNAKVVDLPTTSVRLLYDDAHLYVGCQCDEPAMDALKEQIYNQAVSMFWRDCVEVFLDPEHRHVRFYKFFANAAGESMTQRHWDEGWGASWDDLWGRAERIRMASSMRAGRWECEMGIPWAAVKFTPRPGAVLGFNVNRFRFVRQTPGQPPLFTWSARGGSDNNDPRAFGHLVLGGLAQTPSDLVRLCVPDFQEKEVIVPLPDRMVVFRQGHASEHPYAPMQQEAAAWFAVKQREAQAVLTEHERGARAFRELAKKADALATEVAAQRDRFAAVDRYDAGTATDLAAAQRSIQKSLDDLEGMKKVVQFILEVRATASQR